MNDFSLLAKKFKNKKVLITGASGFVGRNLCDFLVSMNKKFNSEIKLTGMARNSVNLEGVKFYSQDVLKTIEINEKFDFIIHAATPVAKLEDSDKKILDIIVDGTKNILDFAVRSGASHILLVSSGAVYGNIPVNHGPISEDFKAVSELTTAYSKGKMQSEALCQDFLMKNKIRLNVARCFAFSGNHLPINAHFAIGNFVRDALNLKPIHVNGDGSAVRSYMDAEDMVYWLLTILLHDKNDFFNVGSDQAISIKDLANMVAAFNSGLGIEIEGQSTTQISKNIYVPSTSKARDLLGLKLNITLETSIKKMMEFNRVQK